MVLVEVCQLVVDVNWPSNYCSIWNWKWNCTNSVSL